MAISLPWENPGDCEKSTRLPQLEMRLEFGCIIDSTHLRLGPADAGGIDARGANMEKTTLESLEKRVAALEEGLAKLAQTQPPTTVVWKDWRQAIGKYRVSDITKEIDDEGRAIREADRREAQS